MDLTTGIFETVESLRKARLTELEAGTAYGEAKARNTGISAQIEARIKHVIAMAYNEGKIEGGNAQTRQAAETLIINEDQHVKELTGTLADANTHEMNKADEYEKAKIQRRYFEDLLSAQRAVLISQGSNVVINTVD